MVYFNHYLIKGAEAMLRVFILILAIMVIGVTARAEDTQVVGKDDFITGAVTDVFRKIGEYTSGEKGIIIEDYANQPDSGKPAEPKSKNGKTPATGAHW